MAERRDRYQCRDCGQVFFLTWAEDPRAAYARVWMGCPSCGEDLPVVFPRESGASVAFSYPADRGREHGPRAN